LSLLQVIPRADNGTRNEDDDSSGNYDNEEILSLKNYVNNGKNKNPHENIYCYNKEKIILCALHE
jgi:hypothetical protein